MARRFARFKEMKERGYFNDRMAARRAVERGFPSPIELGPNTITWDLDEVESYIDSRPRRTPKSGASRKKTSGELEVHD
jgi:predicted DNA-binding transcriptional regulator AlpA